MKRTTVICAAALVVLASATVLSAEGGTVRGTVSAVVPVDGGLLVVLKGEGIWQAAATVPAENKPAFAAASALKPGDRVTLAWVVDGGRNMVREIVRGDGEKTQALPRTEGEGKRHDEGVTVIPPIQAGKPAKEGANKEADERAWEAQREKEAKQALKEKQYREYQEQRAKEAAAREKDAAEAKGKEATDKEARAKAEAVERYKLARTGAAGTMKTTAKVVSMDAVDEKTRSLKLAAAESGEEMTFKVTTDQEKLYDAVGQLKEGQTVCVYWKTENGAAVLTGVSPNAEKERYYK